MVGGLRFVMGVTAGKRIRSDRRARGLIGRRIAIGVSKIFPVSGARHLSSPAIRSSSATYGHNRPPGRGCSRMLKDHLASWRHSGPPQRQLRAEARS